MQSNYAFQQLHWKNYSSFAVARVVLHLTGLLTDELLLTDYRVQTWQFSSVSTIRHGTNYLDVRPILFDQGAIRYTYMIGLNYRLSSV